MSSRSRLARHFAVALLTLGVSACASVQPAPAQRGWDGRVKIGQPYQVNGVWYYPKDDATYDATGMASWYGPQFHAKQTANGEVFDATTVSAAHPTLPMPSFVEITNLANGRVLTVRINDRGPFSSSRIIDVSQRAAQLLGFHGAGTTKVRVRRVYPKDAPEVQALPPPADVAMIDGRPDDRPSAEIPQAAPSGELAAVRVAPDSDTAATALPGGTVYVQVAAMSSEGAAQWMAGDLRRFGPTLVEPVKELFRVRMGPFMTAAAAEQVLARVKEAGYEDARVITVPKPVNAPNS